MERIEVSLVGEPHRLEDFVAGYAALMEVRDGGSVRLVRLLASDTDFRALGVKRRELDPRLWAEFANLAAGFIARSYGSIEQVPGELRIAAVLDS